MKEKNYHIIGKQVFDLKINQRENASALQQQVNLVWRERLLPAMEKLFDAVVPADQLVRLDRLELNIGELNAHELEDCFVERILEALQPELKGLLKRNYRRPPRTSRKPLR